MATREVVLQMQQSILTLKAGLGEAAIPNDEYAELVELGFPNRAGVMYELDEYASKMIIKSRSAWGGLYVEEVLPPDSYVAEARQVVLSYTEMLADMKARVEAATLAKMEAEAAAVEQHFKTQGPLPDPDKVAAETFKKELSERTDSLKKWSLFGGSGLVVLAVGATVAFAIAYAFFQGFLIRARKAGQG